MALQLLCRVSHRYEKGSAPAADISPFSHFPSGFLLHFDPLAGMEGKTAGTPISTFLPCVHSHPKPKSAHSGTHGHLLHASIASTISPVPAWRRRAEWMEEEKVRLASGAALASLGLVQETWGITSPDSLYSSSAPKQLTLPGSPTLACRLGSLSGSQTMLWHCILHVLRQISLYSCQPGGKGQRAVGKKWTAFLEPFLLHLHLSNLFSLSLAKRQSASCMTAPNN